MSGATLAKSAMTFGVRLGIAAVVLLILGPIINTNFGIGDSLHFAPLAAVWETAPVAVMVTLTYLVLLVPCVLLSATLITASLIIRHGGASEETQANSESTSAVH